MRYSLIREMDVSNGWGVGISLFVQGCHFHCKGCFNQDTWDFNGGKEWTPEIEKKFIVSIGGYQDEKKHESIFLIDELVAPLRQHGCVWRGRRWFCRCERRKDDQY